MVDVSGDDDDKGDANDDDNEDGHDKNDTANHNPYTGTLSAYIRPHQHCMISHTGTLIQASGTFIRGCTTCLLRLCLQMSACSLPCSAHSSQFAQPTAVFVLR
jgi:hypothetical protein